MLMPIKPDPTDLERARELLCRLQDHIRDRVLEARGGKTAEDLAEVAEETAADTIYRIDKVSEEAIFGWFAAHWPPDWPVELVMEGIEDGDPVVFPEGTSAENAAWICVLDPIDGTRSIMYDKRSAWSLAGLAPRSADRLRRLGDIVVAAMTELPTTKGWRSDQVSAIRGLGPAGVRASGLNLFTGGREPLVLRPSKATDFKHGFSSVVRFFPEGKTALARFEEELWAQLHGSGAGNSALVFDDQYISTGGQFYELLCGHDRMLADLRGIALPALGFNKALCCHPYDVCTELVATEAGCLIEGPGGAPLDAPLDTTTAVSWVGYANPVLASLARPVIQEILKNGFAA